MKLISLYTFIFLFTFTNEIRLLEGKSKRSSDRSRSTSPKKNGGNLQNVFGAIDNIKPGRNSLKTKEKQQKQNLMGLKNQLQENGSNGKQVTKYIKKSNKVENLDVLQLNQIESEKRKSIKRQDKEGQEVQKLLNKVSLKQIENKQKMSAEQESIQEKISRKVNNFFQNRNFKLKASSKSNEKKRNLLENKNLDTDKISTQQPIHKRIFEINGNNNNKQDIEKNTDPIEIIYEMGRVQQDLKEEQKYKVIEEMLEKADSILKKYIRIQKNEEKKIIFPKNGFKRFKTKYQQDLIYNGHLVVLVKVINIDNSVLAQSNVLQQTEDHRSTIGFLEINSNRIGKDILQSSYEVQRFILTLVHEIIHILAFNSKKENPLEAGVNKPLQNLSEVAEAQNPTIYQDQHWNEAYIPNDIMTPVSRKNQILTIYTLEMIEEYSSKYQTLPKYLPNNFLFDTIENKKKFFEYKCTNDEAKYPSFCTKKDFLTENWGGCTGDYLFKTYCKQAELGNNCNLNIPTQDGNCMDTVQQNASGFEEYGVDSRCMITDQNFSICAKFRLEEKIINNRSEIRIFFTTRGKEKECTEDGEVHSIGKIRVQGKKKDINVKCPQISKFITYFKKTNCKDQCNQNGFCSDGKCICFDGFDSRDNCKTRIIKNQDKTIFTKYITESF